jgi:hypothetical protein
MDDTEKRAHAPTADLPYQPAWIHDIETTYRQALEDTPVKDMATLRQMYDADLPALTNHGQGLFINILMHGRTRLLGTYRTIFQEYLGHSGQTDTPDHDHGHPRVRFNSNLVSPAHGSLPATMIHEYAHLATIAVYDNWGYPWPKSADPAEEEQVIAKLIQTFPDENNGKYVRWEKWLTSLNDKALEDEVRKVLHGYATYKDYEQLKREALPHVVEIIYYLYKAGIPWWNVSTGPISHVLDLLVKYAF